MNYDPNWPENRYQNLLDLAKQPAWKAYAWGEIQRMSKQYEWCRDFAERFKQEMQSWNAQQANGESDGRND
ncbi:MAG: hypothetical protein KGL39_23765 [Patescibacteria group bacterium]|nr:hypothetical protein [Patescibacteria group bacterium]